MMTFEALSLLKFCPPHTILFVERMESAEANQSIWGWLGGHNGQRSMGKFGQDALFALFPKE